MTPDDWFVCGFYMLVLCIVVFGLLGIEFLENRRRDYESRHDSKLSAPTERGEKYTLPK